MLAYLSSPEIVPYVSALIIGFLGGSHCISMCGGIMAALSFSVPASEPGRRWRILLSYNLGRITSYTLIGVLAGGLGYQLSTGQGLSIMRIIAGGLLIAMGLYLASWWRGLTYLEKAGAVLWRRIQPLGTRLMPVKTPGAAFLLGGVWGWLPCGLVYTALAYALMQASVVGAAGVMLAFGIGTLPAVLASGVFAERIKAIMQKQGLRTLMALFIIGFGLWTIWGTAQHVNHANHTNHTNHPMAEQPSGSMNHDAHMNHEQGADATQPMPAAGSDGDAEGSSATPAEGALPAGSLPAEDSDRPQHHHHHSSE